MHKFRIMIVMLATGFLISCNDSNTGQKTNTDKTIDEQRKSGGTTSDTTTRQSNNNTAGLDDENRSRGWTEADENRFMSDCQSTATKRVNAAQAFAYCDCMLQKIMKRFGTYEEANRELSRSEADMDKLANECNLQNP